MCLLAGTNGYIDADLGGKLTHGDSRRDDAHGQSSIFRERSSNQSQAGDIQEAGPEADADSLRQEDLVVRSCETLHHEPEHLEEAAGEYHGAVVPEIEERAGYDADEDQEEGLHGPDP